MARHTGRKGKIKIGANAVANLRNWSFDETASIIDQTVMGDTHMQKSADILDWKGSATALWDPSDTNGQGALVVGATVGLEFYPDNDGSGDNKYASAAIVSQVGRTSSHDGNVEQSVSLEGTAVLVLSQVV